MIAVTGANGLLGSFIVKKILTEGKPCVAIVREESDLSLIADCPAGLQIRKANILDPVQLEEALKDVTQVIHAAAVVSFNPGKRKHILENNIAGTRNVVNACLDNGVSRLLHISSVAALGRQKGQTVIDENNKWTESSLNSSYAESKYLAELEVFRGQEEGLSTIIVNPSVILAPANWKKSSAQLFKYVWDEKPFYIDSHLNYVDVRDVARIVVSLLASGIEAERFIVNAGNIPFVDFFKKVALRFEKKSPSIRLGKRLLSVAAFAENLRCRVAGIEPLITKETALLAGTHFIYDNQKIKNTLRFDFQSVDETIDWCCAYYLNYIHKK
jgi:dihydroflavonol-4-reductase